MSTCRSRVLIASLVFAACGARTSLRGVEPETSADVPSIARDVADDAPGADCAATTRRWGLVASPTANDLFDVFVVGRGDVWITGDQHALFRHDGASWTRVEYPGEESMRALWFASPTDGWGVTRSSVLRWNGARWQLTAPIEVPPERTLSAVWGSGPRDVWIGGGSVSPQAQILAHFDGARFSTTVPEVPGIQVTSFTGTASNDVWAIGDLGRLVHFDGTRWRDWTPLLDTTLTITACASRGFADVWCVGLRGHVRRFSSGALEISRVGNDDSHLYALWNATADEVWAVGNRGTMAHRIVDRLGGLWSEVPAPTSETLYAIDGRCPTDAWAVGAHGTILRLTP